MMQTRFSLLTLAATLVLSGPVLAQKAGSWSATVGVTQLSPQVTSGDLSAPSLPGTKSGVSSDTEPTGSISYMVNDNVAVNVPLGLGFKHNITGAGANAGVGKIAETKNLPITLLAQYRFMAADAQFRPYVGAGLTYAKFYGTNGTANLTAISNPGGPATTMSIQSKWAPTFQLGVIVNLNERWFLDANFAKTIITTRSTLSTGQTQDNKLDPNAYTLAVGYKF
jgi:outer membrane protein